MTQTMSKKTIYARSVNENRVLAPIGRLDQDRVAIPRR